MKLRRPKLLKDRQSSKEGKRVNRSNNSQKEDFFGGSAVGSVGSVNRRESAAFGVFGVHSLVL